MNGIRRLRVAVLRIENDQEPSTGRSQAGLATAHRRLTRITLDLAFRCGAPCASELESLLLVEDQGADRARSLGEGAAVTLCRR